MTPRLSQLVALFVLGATPGMAQDTLHPEVRTALNEALAQPAARGYDQLFDVAQLRRGSVQNLVDALARMAADDGLAAERRVHVRWILAFCAWRDGRLEDALRALDALPEGAERWVSPLLTTFRRGQLLDGLGRRQAAEKAYQEALVENDGRDEVLATRIRVRLALLGLGGKGADVDGLASFALEEGRDPRLRNRAANILALINKPKPAGDLYEVSGEGTRRFRDEVRKAVWAIRARDAKRAQELAWAARASATLTRDRFYALSVLVESHRMDESLQGLIDKFAAAESLDDPSRQVWIDLLRETGQVDKAVELLRNSQSEFTLEMQRALVDMYRESGQEEQMVATYRELIAAHPESILWRSGLSRHYLERGDTEAARSVWMPLLNDDAQATTFLTAGRALMAISLDDLATRAAESCVRLDVDRYPALLFLFELHLERGTHEVAEQTLERVDRMAAADDGVRAQLSEAYEQLGKLERAVEVLEALRAARGEARLAEDLEMRLAWLYSQVDREDQAMTRWYELWRRVNSVPRRRYVEDRLMTVAARLGRLADIVVDLEDKLAAGTADKQESALLVRLYTKVNDPVSATEVIDEYLQKAGSGAVEALLEKGRIYLACTDYASYEDSLRELMKVDPEGESEHLRSLVMSQLERGRPDEARGALKRLRTIEAGADSAEFEAGVLGLAGLREEAMAAYRKGISRHPDRIEIYLLLANLMRETGRRDQAVGMFQYLAETAEKDDLFTIAIDGLLNMEAGPDAVRWARRVTLERMAERHDKMYLYQLLADLAAEVNDKNGQLDALEGSLAIAGVRRPSILRELMDLSRSGRGARKQPERHLAYGRRLISLSEIVPPQVYLDLGAAFLAAGEVQNAVKTFALAQDVPDYDAFQRQIAGLFEDAGYKLDALRTYERVMISAPTDVGLLLKVAALKEQVGRDDVAAELYQRSVNLLVGRQTLRNEKVEQKQDDRLAYYFARNVDPFQQHYPSAVTGLLVTMPEGEADGALATVRAAMDQAFAQVQAGAEGRPLGSLSQYPRLSSWATHYRRLAIGFDRIDLANTFDLELLERFRTDKGLLESLTRERLTAGLVGAARVLLDQASRPETQKTRLRYLVGGGDLRSAGLVPVAQAAGLLVPLLAQGDVDGVKMLLLKADLNAATAEDGELLSVLFSGAMFVGDENLALSTARAWMRALLTSDGGRGAYEVERLYRRVNPLLSADRQQSLVQFLVDLIVSDLERSKFLIRLLPELQKSFPEPILDTEQATELLSSQRLEYPYGLGPILALVPAEDQASIVRDLWAKVPKTARVRFLLTIASEYPEPISEELIEFLASGVKDALREDDEKFLYYEHYFGQLQSNEKNAVAAERIAAAVAEVRPNEWAPRFVHAAALQRQGKTSAALDVLAPAIKDRVLVDEAHYWRRALDQVAEVFLPQHVDVLLAAIDEAGTTPGVTQRRIELVQRCQDPERLMQALREAVAAHPEDRRMRERLSRELTRAGRRIEGLEVLEGFLAVKPDETAVRSRLVSGWKALRHPVKALAARGKKGADEKVGGARAGGRTAVGTLLGARTASRVVRAIPLAGLRSSGAAVALRPGAVGSTAAGAPSDPKKLPPPTAASIKKALDEGDTDEARVAFRRMWRFGGRRLDPVLLRLVSSGQISLPGGYNAGNPVWPNDPPKKAEKPDDKPKVKPKPDLDRPAMRGGIQAYKEPTQRKAAERKTVYGVLGEHPFAIEEMRRHLRSMRPMEMESLRFVTDALGAAATAAQGADALFAKAVVAVRAGTATRLQYVQLLELVESGAIQATPEIVQLLDDLVRILPATSGGELLRLARVFAKVEELGRAKRLYLWCAALTSGNEGLGRGGAVDPRRVVEEVKEHLDGEDRLEVIRALLRNARPTDRFYSLEPFELMVFDTWEGLFDDPKQVLANCRSDCEAVRDVRRSLRRRSALRAARIFARAGEPAEAVQCLEIALCILPTEGLELDNVYYLRQYVAPGSLSQRQFVSLFPADSEGWVEAGAWNLAAFDAMVDWVNADRVRPGPVVQAAALALVRAHEVGVDPGILGPRVDRLAKLEMSASDRLWLIDAAHRVGRADVAERFERELLEAQELNVARLPKVVERIVQSAGDAEAIALFAKATDYTLHPALLTALEAAAERVGDADAVARWQDLSAQAEAARRTLDPPPAPKPAKTGEGAAGAEARK